MTLRPTEALTLALIERAADQGQRAPTCDEIQELIGCESSSTPAMLVKYLERKGLIRVERYQRERQITIIATGRATAPVKTKAIHWRQRRRPASLPSVSITYVQTRKPELARQIMVAAHREGLSLSDMLLELIWAGWQDRETSIQSVQVEA
jgi:SOS-response transcriptional repressor LexA